MSVDSMRMNKQITLSPDLLYEAQMDPGKARHTGRSDFYLIKKFTGGRATGAIL